MKHLYLIGIGGVGMVWLADWGLRQGWQVSGSDLKSSPGSERLIKAGANIHYGVDPSQIPADITEVIINSAITPSSPSYPELQEIERRGLPVTKRAAWTGAITRQKKTIAVAGTHGKTTTTAMIGWILDKAGLDPTVFVGGNLAAWQHSTKIGKGEYLVIEADEYDRSFHNFMAEMAVVLNIDADHLDYYQGGIEEIEHSFRRFLRNLPPRRGLVVAYGRNKHVRKVCKGFSYRFRWYDEEHLWPGLKLTLPGQHLRLNATAAARIAHEIGIEQEVILEALATFPGVGRRFEHLGSWGAVEVYDDYAHHPREVEATLQAAREKFPRERLVVVFQPHQKARTQALLKEFGKAFQLSVPIEIIIAPIFQVPGREEAISISNADLAQEIGDNLGSAEVLAPQNNEELFQLVSERIREKGVLLTMGAGDLRGMLEKWMSQ